MPKPNIIPVLNGWRREFLAPCVFDLGSTHAKAKRGPSRADNNKTVHPRCQLIGRFGAFWTGGIFQFLDPTPLLYRRVGHSVLAAKLPY